MKAAPVPGAVDLCVTLLKLYGTKSLEEAISPTLALLDAGDRDWHPALAVTLRKLVEAEHAEKGTREEKLGAARDRFYLGDVADELEAWYVSTGAFLRKQDLAAHRTVVEEPGVRQLPRLHGLQVWAVDPRAHALRESAGAGRL